MGKFVLSRVECLMFEADSWTEIARGVDIYHFSAMIREMQPNEKDDNITYAITYEPH